LLIDIQYYFQFKKIDQTQCFLPACIKRSTVIIFIRIVARVDQLMSLCDELEAGLMRSQADSERLMEAVLGRMVAGEEK
jgi:hypothetical protein